MSCEIYLDSAVVSDAGTVYETNTDNFFVNGRTRHDYEKSNVEVALKENGKSFIYGVCDSIREQNGEEINSYEMIKSLKSFHEEFKLQKGDIDSKIKLLEKNVEETNNVLFSKDIKNPKKNKIGFGFSGVILVNEKIAAINIGDCGVYLLRDNKIKELTDEYKRVNKLIKMGILSKEQAKKVKGKRLNMSVGNDKIETRISESIKVKKGDTFLLCSDGLTKNVNLEKIENILNNKKESSYLANNLVQEARKNLADDNITVLVVKIEEIKNEVSEIYKLDKWGKVDNKNYKPDKEDMAITKMIKVALFMAFICIVVSLMYLATNNKDEEIAPVPDSVGLNYESTDILEYIVKEEDTLETISQDFYADSQKYDLIMKMNEIENKKDLEVGEKIYLYPEALIPEEIMDEINEERKAISEETEKTEENSNKDYIIYKIKPGDTLGSISYEFFNTILKADMIKEYNNIQEESELKIDMEIKIPKGE
jgi:protein phosphatase